MKFHPAAELFPLLEGEEFEKFKADIQKNGCLESIIFLDDMILDGRNRWRACQELGIEPQVEDFEGLYPGVDPVEFVISKNLHRRHLNESQRAMVAAKIANLPQGVRKDRAANLQVLPITQESAAKLLNVSERSVADAKAILKKAPKQVGQIERGKKTIHKAKQEMSLSEMEKKQTRIHRRDSENLYILKSKWSKASKTDRNGFLRFIKQDSPDTAIPDLPDAPLGARKFLERLHKGWEMVPKRFPDEILSDNQGVVEMYAGQFFFLFEPFIKIRPSEDFIKRITGGTNKEKPKKKGGEKV